MQEDVTRKKGSEVKYDFSIFFTETTTYLEFNFDLTNPNYICAVK